MRIPIAAAALALPILSFSGPSGAASGPLFSDVAVQAGFDYIQHVEVDPPNCIVDQFFCEPERMSGSVAVGDYDGDGLDDVFVTRLRAPSLLFRNLGNGTYADVAAQVGLGATLNANGSGWADVDNDGDLDLYLTLLGSDRFLLYINDGAGAFAEEGQARGAAVENASVHTGWSVNFGDYDRDGWTDIHVCEWFGTEGISNSRLLRNRGADAPGHFEDVTLASGMFLRSPDQASPAFAFSSAFADMDGDGWQDIAISGDFGNSRLFWNNGDGTFSDGTTEAGIAGEENGMGSTIGDFDGDGRLDWFVTAIFDPSRTCDTMPCNWGYLGNRLHRNEGGRIFSERTDLAGTREGFWGWGAAFFDYDNDGDLDLTMTNGVRFPGNDVELQYNFDPMRLWRNEGDMTTTDVAAEEGVVDTGSGKGLAVFDYENDGDLDIYVANTGRAPVLYRNAGVADEGDGGDAIRAANRPIGSYLRVRVRGTDSNRDGFGARVTMRRTASSQPQLREIGVGTHFLGQSERVAHFGLGSGGNDVAEVRVFWPATGRENVFTDVPVNSELLAIEPAG